SVKHHLFFFLGAFDQKSLSLRTIHVLDAACQLRQCDRGGVAGEEDKCHQETTHEPNFPGSDHHLSLGNDFTRPPPNRCHRNENLSCSTFDCEFREAVP